MKEQLEKIYSEDQACIAMERVAYQTYGLNSKECQAAVEHTLEVNRKHVKIIEDFIKTNGWQSKKLVGPIAAQTPWLIIQHADIETQIRLWPLVDEGFKNGLVEPHQWAKLKDRILMRTNQPQIYGTQYFLNDNGEHEVYQIENPEKVDIERAKLGMGPILDELPETVIWPYEDIMPRSSHQI